MAGKSVPIGLTNLVYAKVLVDEPPTSVGGDDGYTIYDEVQRILGAITANFSPNTSNDTLFADDGPYDSASTLGAMSLELNVADIPAAQRADLLGGKYENGILIHTSEDIPPYVAVGMSVKKSNGYDRYIWYLKGKFTVPDDNNQTKADSINWNTPTITGNFLKRDSDNRWRVSCDTDDEQVPEATKATWFASPNVGTMEMTGEITATPAPADGEIDKEATTSIALSCADSGATIQYKLSTETEYQTGNSVPTTDWADGSRVVLNVKATAEGKAPTNKSFVYTVKTAD